MNHSSPVSAPSTASTATGTARAPTRIAAVQMVSGPDVAANLARASELIARAAGEGAALVALPEYFCLMGLSDTDKVRVREPDGDGPIQAFLAEAAARHRVWLVGGTVPLAAPQPERVFNACLVHGPDGARAARYDKIHLFGFTRGDERFDESATIVPGTQPVAFDTPFARVGLSICYDLRFPELYRALGTVDLLLVPSAFTHTTGQAHWHALLAARAIENQCYVLAPAQGGRHASGRRTYGHSLLLDPWGERLAELPEGEGVAAGTMDPARIAQVRAMLPALAHRTLQPRTL